MTGEARTIEINARVFVLGDELAASLVAGSVVHQCLTCDPAGFAYHLDTDHTVQELVALGAHERRYADAAPELAHRRIPTLFVHHLA